MGTWFQPLQDLQTHMARVPGPASTRSWGLWAVTGVNHPVLQPEPQGPSHHLGQKLILRKNQEGTTHTPRHVDLALAPLSGHRALLYITSAYRVS